MYANLYVYVCYKKHTQQRAVFLPPCWLEQGDQLVGAGCWSEQGDGYPLSRCLNTTGSLHPPLEQDDPGTGNTHRPHMILTALRLNVQHTSLCCSSTDRIAILWLHILNDRSFI